MLIINLYKRNLEIMKCFIYNQYINFDFFSWQLLKVKYFNICLKNIYFIGKKKKKILV